MRTPAPPRHAISMEDVFALYPEVRQSTLQKFDDCPLSSLFQLRYGQGWSTHPQARGTIFHRFAAEALREMQRNDSESIPVGVALSILEETLRQRDVPPEEIIRVPLRDIPALRMACAKFAKDNSFSIRQIVDIERRVAAEITYPDGDGRPVRRVLTGQLDVLLAKPPDEAVVIDWKDSWGLPPKRHEDAEDPGVSYHGYFQQRFYGWLIMKTFTNINAVTLREFYPRRTEVRPARLRRDQLDAVERDLRVLIEAWDRAIATGPPHTLSMEDVERSHWTPQPGKHCDYCEAPHLCPIEDDAALPKAVRTPEQAARWAATRTVAVAVKKKADAVLRPWLEDHGPVPIKWSKGRRVLGVRAIGDGSKTQMTEYTPEGVDRPPTPGAEDRPLMDAMREATRAKVVG